jgi:hypothetical protein
MTNPTDLISFSLTRPARSALLAILAGAATVCTMTSISGCSQSPHVMSKQGVDYELDCIRGVAYYRNGRVLAVAMKPDGTPYACSANKE